MEDIARIGFRAETKELDQAAKKLDDIQPPAKRAEDAAEKLRKRMGMLGGSLGVLGTRLQSTTGLLKNFAGSFALAFGVGMATFGLSSVVKTLANFEHSMGAVQAVTRATTDEMKQMRDMAKQLGATTEFTASQAADGLKFLGMAGFSTADSLAAIPAVLDLSTAASMDLAAAADISSNMMSAFGIAASDAGKVADVLAAAASRANTDIYQMGDGMKYVGPVASAMGVSINDAAAAIGTLSDAGIQGGMAGTGLRRIMSSLANTTPKARDALNRLGIKVNEVNPATTSLVDIVNRLADAGLDAASALTIFGDRGGPAILALVENNEKLESLTNTLTDVEGEASRMAKVMRDTLMGSLKNVQAAAESLIIALGEAGLTNILRAILGAVTMFMLGISKLIDVFGQLISIVTTPVFNILSDNINIVYGALTGLTVAMAMRFIPAIIASIAHMVTWAATFYIINGGLIGMTAALYTTIAAFVTLRGAMLATGFGAIAVAVGVVVAKVLDLRDELGSMNAVWLLMKAVAAAVWKDIADTSRIIIPALKAVWAAAKADFLLFIADISQIWANFLGSIYADVGRLNMLEIGDFKWEIENPLARPLKDAIDSAQTFSDEIRQESENAAGAASAAFSQIGETISQSFDFEQLKTDARLAALGLGELGDVMPGATQAASELDEEITDLGDSLEKTGGKAEKAKQSLTALQKLTEEFDKLSEPFKQAEAAFKSLEFAKDNGIISNDQFVASLARIESAFIASGGSAEQWALIVNGATESVADQMKQVGERSIDGLNRSIADLAVDGKANFSDLRKSIIKDLVAIAWQAYVTKPLLGFMGFKDGGTFGAPPSEVTPFAKGGAFTNDVVSRPTPFKFAQGGGFGLGVMGEAGPEAVMPLTRGPDGSLGVQMYASGSGGGRQGCDDGPTQVELIVRAEEGEMFRSVVRSEAENVAVHVVQESAPAITSNSVSAAQKSMRKSKTPWGMKS